MVIVIKITGLLLVLTAIFYLAKPDVIKRMMEFFRQGKRIYFAGLIRLILAVIFLAGARECDITWLIFTLGLLFLISAFSIFLMGPEKVNVWISWWLKKPIWTLQLLSILTLAFGAMIIYAA